MIDRRKRHFLLASGALGLAALQRPVFAQPAKSITVVSWGGSYQAAQSKTVWQPVAKKLGITLNEETYSGLADLRLRVKSGANTWDVVSIGSAAASRAGAEGLLETIDYTSIDTSAFVSGYTNPQWIGADLFSTVIAWNTKFGNNGPKTWADFWDVKRFPGPRSYRSQSLAHLEPALLADGVAPDKIYALLSTDAGLKRAIDKIASLKPHISAFWSSGAQQTQLLRDGAVDMSSGWSGQITAIMRAGAPVAYTYNQGLLDAYTFVVPKGAPEKEVAMRFVSEASKPVYQAAFSSALPYGAVNQKAYAPDLMAASVAAELPSAPQNISQQFKVDPLWWRENQARAEKLYQQMVSS